MPKNFFQDVVPPERRSIRNIPVMSSPHRHRRPPLIEERVEVELNRGDEEEKIKEFYSGRVEKKRRFFSGKTLIALALILVAGFIFGMMTAFTSAKVDITPKKETASFNLNIKALKNSAASTSTTPVLKYEIVDLRKESQIEVPANGEEIVEKKAKGSITIYNNFSSEPQRLIARTRFETTEGLIYRINESVVVPGKTALSPGTLQVTVSADEAGEKYNISKADFTVPGFKSDPERYKGFYAKLNSSMSGGFVGKAKKVAEGDKEVALSKLENSLRQELEKETEATIPEGFVALKGSTVYEFNDLGQAEEEGGMGNNSSAVLKMEAVAHVVVFDKQFISSAITKQFAPNWGEIPSEIRSFEGISVTFDPGSNINSGVLGSNLAGNAEIFAIINAVEVADRLAGKNRSALEEILNTFPAIFKASASIRPIWQSSFPQNTAKIHINIE